MEPRIASDASWTFMQKSIFRLMFLFVTLFIFSFSFPHFLLPDPGDYMHPFFEKAAAWFGHHILQLPARYNTQLISDSTGFYVNALFLFIVSLLLAVVWAGVDKRRQSYNTPACFFYTGVRYYLAIQLLAYGTGKLFKGQFYLPEPNILYTPLGQLHRDILYWSTLGISHTYSLITGSIEILAAIFLLYRKTALAGAFIAMAALFNIFIINISFDISVKLYSLFLLLLTAIIIAPYTKGLYLFLQQKGYTTICDTHFVIAKYRTRYLVIKPLLILLILADALVPYIKANNYNDDAAARPFLHGAYDAVLFVKNGDTLAPLLTDSSRWRRVFIHRSGYFIIQFMNDSMQDFELSYDTANKKLWISKASDSTEHPLHYVMQHPDTLGISGVVNGAKLFIRLKKTDMEKLPLLQPSFHWTIDQ